MIWAIIVSIKIIFGVLIYKFYQKSINPTLDIANLENAISYARKKSIIFYIISISAIVISFPISNQYKKWMDNRPFETNIIGNWNCNFEVGKFEFLEENLFILRDTIEGNWNIDDSVLTLEFIDETILYDIVKITSDRFKGYRKSDKYCLICSK